MIREKCRATRRWGRSAVAAMVVVAAAYTVSDAQRLGWYPHVDIGLQTTRDHTGLVLSASSYGEAFKIDPSKLRFFARPHGAPDALERPLSSTFGSVTFVTPPQIAVTGKSMNTYTVPVELTAPYGTEQLYDIRIAAADGFAHTANGELPVGLAPPHALASFSWPHDAGDARLGALRRRLVGRMVNGYGGIAVSCSPQWTHFYTNATPLRVRSIERERGKIIYLGVGNTPYPASYGIAFLAVDPIRIVFDEPAQLPTGANAIIKGLAGPCPALVLADWQVDVTLSLTPPPASAVTATQSTPIAVGMTREDIVWRRGYPDELGDRATLRSQPVWFYGQGGSGGRTALTFSADRVVSLTTPGPML